MAPTSRGRNRHGWDRNRRFGLEGHAEARCRVRVRAVRRHVRPAERKLVPVGSREAFDGLLAEGAGFAGFAAGEIGQVPSDPDIAAIPDLASYTPVPWQGNLARFACDVTVEGEEWPYCPRTILRRMLARARDKGYEFKMGLELEYFLVKQLDDGSIEIADRYDTLEKPCYDIAGLTRRYDFLTTVSKNCNDLGWGTTRTTTRTRTGSSSRTSPTTTRSSPATGRSSSVTWFTPSRSRRG